MNYQDTAVQELIEHNDELESYFRNTIFPQLYVDGSLKLQKFTPPAMKQFDLSVQDIGKHISDIKDNFRYPAIIENIGHVINSNKILEQEIQTTDMRWYQMNIIPYVTTKSKKTNGVIISFVEVTRRIKNLKELEKVISDYEILLDTISHDIRNPFASLVMAIECLKTVSWDNHEQFDAMLTIVDNSVKRMYKVFTELTATRMGEYKYEPGEELVNFEHVLEDVRLTLHDSILACGAIINFDIKVPCVIYSERKLRTIIYNLVNNAIKFRVPLRQLQITISTIMEDDFIVVSVKDNGVGIEPEKQNNIFLKYYRIENGIEGSGIGLYLVNEIVSNCGGKIVVNSEVSKGTEFRIYLKKTVK